METTLENLMGTSLRANTLKISFLDGNVQFYGKRGDPVYYHIYNNMLTVITPPTGEGGELYYLSYPLANIREIKQFPVIED